jgi:hypothetical protein
MVAGLPNSSSGVVVVFEALTLRIHLKPTLNTIVVLRFADSAVPLLPALPTHNIVGATVSG